MNIERYGIALRRLTNENAEMLRQWRNADNIRQFMEYRQVITPQQQQQWYNKLHPLNDHYFIIYTRQTPIGMIHLSNINWKERSGHAGLFIYREEYIKTYVPVLASITLLDVFVLLLGIEKVYAKVGTYNAIAKNYNEQLGFAFHELTANPDFAVYLLQRSNYLPVSKRWNRLAGHVADSSFHIQVAPQEKPLFSNYRQQQIAGHLQGVTINLPA